MLLIVNGFISTMSLLRGEFELRHQLLPQWEEIRWDCDRLQTLKTTA